MASGIDFEHEVCRTRGLGHRYAQDARPALAGVDLRIDAGGVVVLAGRNGGGKTTLLRALAGQLQPTEGDVTLLGVTQPARATKRDRVALRRTTGFVGQSPALDPEMTCAETLLLLAALHGVPTRDRTQLATDTAARFGVTPWLDERVAALSGGLRRRLHLALGLLHEPTVAFLDEPEAGLDADGRERLWTLLRTRAEAGRSTVVSSHDLSSATDRADRVVLLDRGAVVADDAPRALLHQHGRPVVHVQTLHRLDPAALHDTVDLAADVVCHSEDGTTWSITLPADADSEAAARQILESGLDLIGLRVEPPHLDGLLRRMTAPAPDTSPGGRRRPEGARRDGRHGGHGKHGHGHGRHGSRPNGGAR